MKNSASEPKASTLLGYFVSHRTAANLLLMVMIVAGIVAGTKIRAQFFPDVAVDKVNVTIAWSGVGPREMDEAIVSRIEPRLRTVEGVKAVTAVARQGTASVALEFEPGWDTAQAVADVKAALDEVRDLPADAEPAVVRPSRWRDRVTDVMISGGVGVDLLNRYAEEFRAQLYRRGVTLTSIDGVSAPEVRIDVRPRELERHKLTMADITAAIKSETGTQPVGQIESTRARVRTATTPLTAEALAGIAVRSNLDGSKIALRDVADVSEEGLDRKIALYHDGLPAVVVEINRDAKGDAIRLQAAVEQAMAAMAPTLPKGVMMQLVNPRAKAISDRLEILVRNGLQGLLDRARFAVPVSVRADRILGRGRYSRRHGGDHRADVRVRLHLQYGLAVRADHLPRHRRR